MDKEEKLRQEEYITGDSFTVDGSAPIEKKSRKRRSGRRRKQAWKPLVLSLLGILVILYLLACISVKKDITLKTVLVNGVDVSGLHREQVMAVLENEFDHHFEQTAIPVTVGYSSYEVSMADCLELDVEECADLAGAFGHGTFIKRGLDLIRAVTFGKKYEVLPELKNRELLYEAIQDSGLEEALTTVQTSYEVKDEQILFTKGVTGGEVDVDRLAALLEAAIEAGDYVNAIEAPMNEVPLDGINMKKIYKKLHKEVSEPTLDPKHNYKIVKAVRGFDFDVKEAQIAYDQAEEGAVVAIPVHITFPNIRTKDFKKALFRDELASVSSNISGTDARMNNIAKAIKAIDGKVLLAGDSFSFNKLAGKYTTENGYKKTIESAVGTDYIANAGVTQVASVLYKATVLADLTVVERHAHRYVPEFIGLGMDAYVSDSKDYKFKNETGYPVKIKASYDGSKGSINIKLIGSKTDEKTVKFEAKTIKTEKYGTEYWDDPKSAVGNTYVYISGKEGKTVETYRKYYGKKGKVLSSEKEAKSEYESRNQVIMKGSYVMPEPEVTEETGTEGTTDSLQ